MQPVPITTSEFESRSWRGVLDATLCDKVCQKLATGRLFSPGTSVSCTNKSDRHDITEILLYMCIFSYSDIVCVYFPTVILYVFINLLWYCMCLFSYSDLVCVYFPTVILYVYIFLQWYFMCLFSYCDIVWVYFPTVMFTAKFMSNYEYSLTRSQFLVKHSFY